MALSLSASLARPSVAPRRTLAVRQTKRVVVAMSAPKPEAVRPTEPLAQRAGLLPAQGADTCG